MYFSAAAFLGETPGQHELGLKDRSGPFNPAVESGRQIADQRVPNPLLDVGDNLAGVAFKPMPVEVFGDPPKLDNEVAGQVLRFGFAALLPPKPEQGRFVRTHDDPGVGAADEMPPIRLERRRFLWKHDKRSFRFWIAARKVTASNFIEINSKC